MKVQSRVRLSFLYAVPIALLGSLMGLGGAEFRLPVLAGPLGYLARQAVALNLVVSLITILTTSLPTVLVGVIRYAGQGAFANRQSLRDTVTPMGVGSVIGAVLGGLLVGIAPAAWLKFSLGLILMISAWRIFRQ